jgi:Lrp/AsnC family transcriptional regulator for asnA, asnC and gidA
VSKLPQRDLDAVDNVVIAALQEDGRRPYSEIAREVGLSEGAVRSRVRRLRESGAIRIVALADPQRTHSGVAALVGVTVRGDPREVARRLAQAEEIEYVVVTAGSFDLFLEVVAADHDGILGVVGARVRADPGVVGTETFIHLGIEKMVFAWGRKSAVSSGGPDPA